jgi:hypothetical protein
VTTFPIEVRSFRLSFPPERERPVYRLVAEYVSVLFECVSVWFVKRDGFHGGILAPREQYRMNPLCAVGVAVSGAPGLHFAHDH